MWLQELKIAVIQADVDLINALIKKIPVLKDENEIDEAKTLVNEALSLLVSLQEETKKSMQKIQKNINFLKATEVRPTSSLDVSS